MLSTAHHAGQWAQPPEQNVTKILSPADWSATQRQYLGIIRYAAAGTQLGPSQLNPNWWLLPQHAGGCSGEPKTALPPRYPRLNPTDIGLTLQEVSGQSGRRRGAKAAA